MFPLSRSFRFDRLCSVARLRESISGGFFRIVLEYPLSLRHPLAQALGLFRRVLMLGAIEFACGARERLDAAGPREPERLIQLQAACDIDGSTSLEKNGKRDCIFD